LTELPRVTSEMNIHVFCTSGFLTHVAACFIQGITAGRLAHVSINLESVSVDSRSISTPDLNGYALTLATRQGVEDVLVIDESRALSGGILSDPSISQFYNTLRDLSKKKPVLVLYMQDDANFVRFPEGLTVFSSHRNKFACFENDPLPLPFSVSLDILNRADQSLARGHARKMVAIRNFRPSYNQAIRDVLDLALVPLLSKVLEITDGLLFDEAYAEQLSASQMVLAYGGTLYPDFSINPSLRAVHLDVFKERAAVFRWDSWRFWESLAFGCATVQLDCEKYGFVLPHTPTPWVHYIPLDLANIPGLVRQISEELESDPSFLLRIGEQGRAWMLHHYHPTKRALEILREALVRF